jgi:hypothetical protein
VSVIWQGLLVRQRQILDQGSPGIKVGGRTQMDLVYRVSGGIKELQRAAQACVRAAFNRKSKGKVAGEKPQINLGGEHHGGMFAGTVVAIGSDLFDHAGVVARQGHDLSQCGKPWKDLVELSIYLGHALTQIGGHQLGFADVELRGKIAITHLVVFLTHLANGLRVQRRSKAHVWPFQSCKLVRKGLAPAL